MTKVVANKKEIGKTFKGDAKAINQALDDLTDEQRLKCLKEMDENKQIKVTVEGGQEFTLTHDQVAFERFEKTVMEEKFTPSVIEPSFGIGRVIYCIFEHCFKMREGDAARTYFTFPATIAPLKCSILPLISQPAFNEIVQEISKLQRIIEYRVFINKRGHFIQGRRLKPDHWQEVCPH